MKAYLVTLQPHELFFFGGEKTFGNNNEANYFVKSRYFPQQTALLGLMRYQVLAAHGLLKTRGKLADEAADYIGESSFNSSDKQSFGKIAGLSHLFLKDGDTFWNFAPRDLGFTYTKNSIEGYSVLSNQKTFVPFISEGFDYKKGITNQLISNKGITKSITSFFTPHSQVGIGKSRKGTQSDREDSKQFYKQMSYRFTGSNMCFAFVVYFNEEKTANKIVQHIQSNPNVFFGGERRIFKMQIKTIDKSIGDFWKSHQVAPNGLVNQELYKLILLSDAYAKSTEVYDNCDFAVSEVINFQHLITKVKHTKNYSNLNKKHESHSKVSKSTAINLLQKGSVFYASNPDQLQKLQKVFEKAKGFKKIGYNAFVTVNSELKTHFYHPQNNQ